MQRFSNDHFELWGEDLEMPMVHDSGFNAWQVAEHLSWHSHDGYELIVLIDGQASFEFEDGVICELAGGEFFFKLPGQVHRATDDVFSPCKMCWVVFDLHGPQACTNTIFNQEDLEYLAQRYRADERKVFTYNASLKPLLEEFCLAAVDLHSNYRPSNPHHGERERNRLLKKEESSFVHARPHQIAALRLYICRLLLETVRQSLGGPRKNAGDLVAAAIAFMEKHYEDDIDIDRIASHLGLSRSYLHTVFRNGTGQTPNDYLQRTRIRAAENSLANSDSSITEIASRLGFSSSQYFSKVFHKYTRQTPQEYRKAKLRQGG